MKKRFLSLLIFILFASSDFCFGVEELFLEADSSFSRSAQLRVIPLKKNIFLLQQVGFQEKKEKDSFSVVEFFKRAFNTYGFRSLSDSRVLLVKTNNKSLQKGSGVSVFHYYPRGEGKVDFYSSSTPENWNKAAMISAYREKEFPVKVVWKKEIDRLKESCHRDFAIDWESSFNSNDQQQLKNRSVLFLRALADLCATDSDYKEAVTAINSLRFKKADEGLPKITVTNNEGIVQISGEDYRLERFSMDWLKENL